jgi:hypothetical protein
MNTMNKEDIDMIQNFGKYMAEAPEEIPDVDKLIGYVISFLEYINTEEMQKLENDDPIAFEKHLDNKFSDFTLRYYTTFKLLLDKENRESNIARLLELFEKFKKVQTAEKTMDNAWDEYTEDLNTRYIYSKFGGKKNFEKGLLKKKNKKAGKQKNNDSTIKKSDMEFNA